MNNSQNTKRKKQVYDLRGKEYIFIGKDKVHKPDKKKSNSVLQQSSDSSTSCLGEKHNPEYVQKDSTLCKKERCGGVYLTGQNSCKDINPMRNMRMGEKLTLKEKETADMLIEYVVEMDKKLKEALIKELRSKNPLRMKRYYESKVDAGYDIGWSACVDELERLLKEKRK